MSNDGKKNENQLKKEGYSSTDATINATINATIKSEEKKLTKTKAEILELIQRDENITVDQLAELTEKHRATIVRNLNLLQKIGVIERIGSRKTGHWKVKW